MVVDGGKYKLAGCAGLDGTGCNGELCKKNSN